MNKSIQVSTIDEHISNSSNFYDAEKFERILNLGEELTGLDKAKEKEACASGEMKFTIQFGEELSEESESVERLSEAPLYATLPSKVFPIKYKNTGFRTVLPRLHKARPLHLRGLRMVRSTERVEKFKAQLIKEREKVGALQIQVDTLIMKVNADDKFYDELFSRIPVVIASLFLLTVFVCYLTFGGL